MRYNEDSVVGIFDDEEVCWEIRRVGRHLQVVLVQRRLCKEGDGRRDVGRMIAPRSKPGEWLMNCSIEDTRSVGSLMDT